MMYETYVEIADERLRFTAALYHDGGRGCEP